MSLAKTKAPEWLVRLLERKSALKVQAYDPMDEKRQFTLEEFIAVVLHELEDYRKVWSEEPRNQYHVQTHTWNEWWDSLHKYWSW